MPATQRPEEPSHKCRACGQELPKSASKSTEGQEYLQHYCGLDCYRKWTNEHGEERSQGR